MSKVVENGKLIEQEQIKCKVCGLGNIAHDFDICEYCGWEADDLQNENSNYSGGANDMSLNQYKQFWEKNKDDILKNLSKNRFYAIDKAREFYKENFEKVNLDYYRSKDPDYDIKMQRAEENRRKRELERQQENSNTSNSDESDYEFEKSLKKQKLVRNQFKMVGKYGMPIIKKQEIDLDKIDLLGYVKTKPNDEENKNKTIHFFTYDWNFESVFDKPEKAMEKLDQYYALLSPEFSLYWDMPKAVQIYNTFKNRWCGAFWQKMGKIVIPTVCCAGEESYDFCFDGIEEGSVVAISTYRREQHKHEILKSYNKMLEVIKPSAVIIYGEAFPEMKGNIKVISPFNKEELIAKMGIEEFMRKYLAGELYPSRQVCYE